MFPSSKLFGTCPNWSSCSLGSRCLFSKHQPPPTPSSAPPPTSTATASSSALKRLAAAPALGEGAPKRIVTTVKSAQAPVKPAASTAASAASRSSASSSGGAGAARTGAAAADALPAGAGPPRLPPQRGPLGHTPATVRQKMLTTLYNQFLEIYSPGILPTSLRHQLASQHAVTQEESLYSRATKATYRNACISALARLKKRAPARTVEETGTLEDEAARAVEKAEELEGRLTRARVAKFVASKEKLRSFDYMLEVPSGAGGDKVTEEGNVRVCDRCKKEFVVRGDLSEDDRHACAYHYGRVVTEKIGGQKQRVWSCCPAVGAPPCQTGPHVFKDEDPKLLHARVPFLPSSSLRSSSSSATDTALPPAIDLAALDCELIYTTSGMSLARLTVLSASGSVLMDEHVRPPEGSRVLDLNTRFSGVKEGEVEGAVLDVQGVRRALAQFMDERTILVGHGVENDLKALRLVHTQVIDTAILFPHPNGGTWRHSLRNLTKDILGKFIQQDDPTIGHSAADDASAALELVRWKVKKEG
ncbi:hypothetical protein JCM8097_004835 [Rhodosporidiobolus ruineniae]